MAKEKPKKKPLSHCTRCGWEKITRELVDKRTRVLYECPECGWWDVVTVEEENRELRPWGGQYKWENGS